MSILEVICFLKRGFVLAPSGPPNIYLPAFSKPMFGIQFMSPRGGGRRHDMRGLSRGAGLRIGGVGRLIDLPDFALPGMRFNICSTLLPTGLRSSSIIAVRAAEWTVRLVPRLGAWTVVFVSTRPKIFASCPALAS